MIAPKNIDWLSHLLLYYNTDNMSTRFGKKTDKKCKKIAFLVSLRKERYMLLTIVDGKPLGIL